MESDKLDLSSNLTKTAVLCFDINAEIARAGAPHREFDAGPAKLQTDPERVNPGESK